MYIENVLQKLVLDPFLIFEIVLKQPILDGSFFETKIFRNNIRKP